MVLSPKTSVTGDISVTEELRKLNDEIVAIRRSYRPMRFANWFYSWRMIAAAACIFAGALIALIGTRAHSASFLLAGLSLFAFSSIGFACCSLYASAEIIYQGLYPCGGREALADDIERVKANCRKRIRGAEPDRRCVAVYERIRWRRYADCFLSWVVSGTGLGVAGTMFGKADLAALIVSFYHMRTAMAEVCVALLVMIVALALIVRSRFDEELDVLRVDAAA